MEPGEHVPGMVQCMILQCQGQGRAAWERCERVWVQSRLGGRRARGAEWDWTSGLSHRVCIPSRGPEERHRECVPVGDSRHHPGSLLEGSCLNERPISDPWGSGRGHGYFSDSPGDSDTHHQSLHRAVISKAGTQDNLSVRRERYRYLTIWIDSCTCA